MSPDIEQQMDVSFGPNAAEARGVLTLFLQAEERHVDDRLLRCILYLAHGSLTKLGEAIDLAEKDSRDVIWSAEYDGTDVRQRDFHRPFP